MSHDNHMHDNEDEKRQRYLSIPEKTDLLIDTRKLINYLKSEVEDCKSNIRTLTNRNKLNIKNIKENQKKIKKNLREIEKLK